MGLKRTVKNKYQKLIFPKKEKTLISKLKIAFKTLIFIIDDPFGRLYNFSFFLHSLFVFCVLAAVDWRLAATMLGKLRDGKCFHVTLGMPP